MHLRWRDLRCNGIVRNILRDPEIKDIQLRVLSRKLPAIIIGCVFRHSKETVLSFDYIQEAVRSTLMQKKNILSFVI